MKILFQKNYVLIDDLAKIDEYLKEAEEIGEICIDTETTSLNPHEANLVGISLSVKTGHACYIPVGHKNNDNLDEKRVLQVLKPVLQDSSIKKIGQNIKFDFIVLYKRGIQMNSLEDTMLMSYVLDAGKIDIIWTPCQKFT